MAISPNDFRNGLVFQRGNDLLQVMEFLHVKPGKGPAFVRAKIKNLRTGSIVEEKFRPSERFEEVRVETRKYDYLYPENDFLVVMDKETYDQIYVPKELLGEKLNLLVENEELSVAMNGDEPLSVELPLAVVRKVEHCEPGVKGDTATGATKPATVEGGAVVNVPLFINEGDRIKINTAEGSYVERVKD